MQGRRNGSAGYTRKSHALLTPSYHVFTWAYFAEYQAHPSQRSLLIDRWPCCYFSISTNRNDVKLFQHSYFTRPSQSSKGWEIPSPAAKAGASTLSGIPLGGCPFTRVALLLLSFSGPGDSHSRTVAPHNQLGGGWPSYDEESHMPRPRRYSLHF